MEPAKRPSGLGPGERAALAAAGVLALLAIVALGTRGHGWGGGSGGTSGLPTSFWDTVFSIFFVVFLVCAGIVLWMYAQMRHERGTQGYERRMHFVAAIVFLATVLGLALAYAHWGRGRGALIRRPAQQTSGQNGHQDRLPTRPRHPGVQHHFNYTAAAIALAVLIGAAAVAVAREKRRKRPPKERVPGAAEALAATIDDTLDDLRREPDPRRAVIAAYARMERSLAAHGLPRLPSEAPHEYLARALVELDASAASARHLTTLFERAKFSPHLVDLAMKQEAIEALVRLRDELLTRDAEPEPAPL